MNRYSTYIIGGLAAATLTSAIAIGTFAREYTEVKLTSPGELAGQFDSLNALRPEALRISGVLDSRDIIALRKLCGRAVNLDTVNDGGSVTALDLRETRFLPDGKAFVRYNNMMDSATITSPHSLPPIFLYQCGIRSIKLPVALDTIHAWALADIPIEELDVPDGAILMPRSIAMDTTLRKLHLSYQPTLYNFSEEKVTGLREIKSDGFLYSGGAPCWNLTELETFEVEGPVARIDATPFANNPKLRTITFNGPIYHTGSTLISEGPALESIEFNGPIGIFGFYPLDKERHPKIDDYTFNAPVFYSEHENVPALNDSLALGKWEGKDEFLETYAAMAPLALEGSTTFNNLEYITLEICSSLQYFSDSIESRRFLPEIDSIMAIAKSFDSNKSKIQILKESAPYANGSDTIQWRYAAASDPLLASFRERFNLDSVAGQGDDYSKIKNLTYWIHESMPHNGGRGDMPKTPYDLDKLIEYGVQDSLGGNCRIMAIALQQALLAEGIPARFLTCQSKNYDTDPDCHVICAAWSREHDKWVWCDPTFAAFVTAPDGTPLHPGEVRERLIRGEEICLNEDANWNHRSPQTKEYYLDNYMAKNLYLISAYEHQAPRVEGPESEKTTHITLAPEGFDFRWGEKVTADSEEFWKRPE